VVYLYVCYPNLRYHMTSLIKSIQDIKNVIAKSEKSLALVPTMGSLHAGHISLIKAAKNECKTTIVYIFVNPLQFGPAEDFKEYPRDLAGDLKICEENNVDFIFAPEISEIYPDIEDIKNNPIKPPPELTNSLCGKTRQNHFSGVATVVKRFLDIIEPDFIYFGEKDLQQLHVIKWLVKEFNLSVNVKSCPTIRETTGLAYSSRNKYLTPEEKTIAASLYKALKLAKGNTRSGIFPVNKSILESLIFLSHFSQIKVEYVEARDKANLAKVPDDAKHGFYYLIAAKIGKVRLIDNIEVV